MTNDLLKRFYQKESKKTENINEIANELLKKLKLMKQDFKNKHAYEIDEWIESINKALLGKNQNLIKIVINDINEKLNPKIESEFHDLIHELKAMTLPNEIKSEILLDFKEAVNSFNAKNFRATIMLCARILETVLFRKYYDLTGKDLLETAPGYGLGKLVAELRKLNQVDPAIMQQIHLINQIRIYSVHKKKDPFMPTEEQTKAVLLYTFDLIKKLYG